MSRDEKVPEEIKRVMEFEPSNRMTEPEMVSFNSSGLPTVALTQNMHSPRLHSMRLATNAYVLVATDGPHVGEEFPLGQDVLLVGRGDICDLQLHKDISVSERHCDILLDLDGVRVIDRGSRNGIQLENQRVKDAYISVGGRLKLGHTTLMLQVDDDGKTEIEVNYYDDSEKVVGSSSQMRQIFTMLRRLGKRDITVLLTGETGTGKTAIAEALHEQSNRSSGPFVTINCGSIPANLIESELLGYEKGAFTGADRSHEGLIEQANGGTLFLDEIGELPLELQPKLLKVIEQKSLRRVGGSKEISVDFRLISATLKDLRAMVKDKSFREDLYYRLAVVELEVPPLRARVEDIPLLVEALLHDLEAMPGTTLTEAAMKRLQRYIWPGNVRELRNVLDRAVAFQESPAIDEELIYLPNIVEQNVPSYAGPLPSSASLRTSGGSVGFSELISGLSHYIEDQDVSLRDLMEQIEKAVLRQALDDNEGKVLRAAKALKISKSWAYDRVNKYDLRRK